jgi:hypothetical protein
MGKKVYEIFGLGITPGDVGIEIEVEGNKTPMLPISLAPFWKLTGDNSLRGPSGEYVLKKPMKLQKALDSVDMLKEVWDVNGFKAKHSIRAGVHIHINCQELTLNELWRFAFLYYTFETVLTKYCGPNRAGNHFCLRFKDAEYLFFILEQAICHKGLGSLYTDSIRYSSLNYCSLSKYGSLEFRAMETEPTLEKTKAWAEILLRLKEYAVKELNSVSEIPEQLSYHGPSNLLNKIVGEHFQALDYPLIDQDIMQDFRNIQLLLNEQAIKEMN